MISANTEIRINNFIKKIEDIFAECGFDDKEKLFRYAALNDQYEILKMTWRIEALFKGKIIDGEEEFIQEYLRVIYQEFDENNFARCNVNHKYFICRFVLRIKEDFLDYVREIAKNNKKLK